MKDPLGYLPEFFHELVSSQLDMDRLDYLKRDSYFTGVSEGAIGAERIIRMLNIVDDGLVVEEKGIYSIENFLSARRLMYWQVYLHKATISADRILNNIIQRVKVLYRKKMKVFTSPDLIPFLEKEVIISDFNGEGSYLRHFTQLDDHDIWYSIKCWSKDRDYVLSNLSNRLLNRDLFQISITNERIEKDKIQRLKSAIQDKYNLSSTEASYFLSTGSITNSAYISEGKSIGILMKSGKVLDIAKAADLPNIKAMSKIVRKYYLCWPKDLSL